MMRIPRQAAAALLALACTAAATSAATAQTATIRRDAWGVPHVFSETDAGVMFGMAWALAEDDWDLIEGNYLHALGRHAELAGEQSLQDDWMARALELVPLSIREYTTASPRLRGMLDAYAAGLNAWLAQRPAAQRRVLDHVEPWYPLALLRYKYYQNEYLGYAGLRGPWAQRLFREGLPGVGRRIAAADVPVDAVGDEPRYYESQFDGYGLRPRGSNQWAIAPARTASGSPLLLINPHQSFVGVQRYAEIHLDSNEGLRFAGLTVFGFLLPYMGHSDRLGWAYTDNYPDHSDLYAEAFDDRANPLGYRYAGERRTAETWTDSIRVKSGDTFVTRRFEFWKTVHGPVVGIHDDGRILAVKLAKLQEGGWFAQWDAMIRARNLDQWRTAVAQGSVAYMNTMYADVDGNIGYIYNGAVPRRKPGIDPRGILDGSTPDTEWQGFHTLAELPQLFNPATGWLMNTNSTPFTATLDMPFDRAAFPAYMVGTETDNARAVSSRRILRDLPKITFDEFARLVWDTRLSVADSVIPALSAEVAQSAERLRSDVQLAGAAHSLMEWDRIARAQSVATTWFIQMTEHRTIAARNGVTSATPWLDALGAALRQLQDVHGSADVQWGTINRHQRPLPGAAVQLDPSRPSLPIDGASGGLGSVFSYGNNQFGSAAPRMGVGGNSFVMVVEFGPQVRARSILNYGQNGNPASPHFFDQAALYAQRQFKPAWFGRDEVVHNAARTYTVSAPGK